MEPITRKEVFLNAMCADKPCDLEPVSREEILLKRLVEAEAGEGGGSGLPAGSKPNQYIVTDGEGNAKWEDKLWWIGKGEAVLEEQTVEYNQREQEGGNRLWVNTASRLKVGEIYIVVVDGVCHRVPCFTDESRYPMLGVADLDFSKYPFFAYMEDNNNNEICWYLASDGEHTVAIYTETIHKMSGKYVEGMGWSEPVALLKESDAAAYEHPSFGKAWLIENAPKLTVGETYTVTYNGNDYTCVCQSAPYGLSEDVNAVAMGNFSVAGGQDTGEPFAMMISTEFNRVDVIDLSGASAVTVAIVKETIHPIDKKYLSTSVVFHWDADESILTNTSGNVVSYEEAKAAGRNVVIKYDGYECAPVSIKDDGGSVFYNIYAAGGWQMPSAGRGPL